MSEASLLELELADRYVQETSPALMVPRAKPLEPLAADGHRFLVACDGVYLEYRRQWVSGIVQISKSSLQMPFGVVRPYRKLACSKPPAELWDQFMRLAQVELPNEVAAWFVWNQDAAPDRAWRFVKLEPITSSAGHIQFHRPVLQAGEHLVVDIHSHGSGPAFFSSIDDRSDRELGEVKMSVVIGKVGAMPQRADRFCACGHLFDERKPHEGKPTA